MTDRALMTFLTPEQLQTLIREAIREEIATRVPEEKAGDDDLITQAEACKLLRKSRQTLATWRKRGLIAPIYIGGAVYYKKSELIEQNR